MKNVAAVIAVVVVVVVVAAAHVVAYDGVCFKWSMLQRSLLGEILISQNFKIEN